VVELGDVAFLDTGKAICLFFGNALQAVNVFGKIILGIEELKKVKEGFS